MTTAAAVPLSFTVNPVTVRTEYKLSTQGHRFVGLVRGEPAIDSGWHTSPQDAATAYGVLLGELAAASGGRYA